MSTMTESVPASDLSFGPAQGRLADDAPATARTRSKKSSKGVQPGDGRAIHHVAASDDALGLAMQQLQEMIDGQVMAQVMPLMKYEARLRLPTATQPSRPDDEKAKRPAVHDGRGQDLLHRVADARGLLPVNNEWNIICRRLLWGAKNGFAAEAAGVAQGQRT